MTPAKRSKRPTRRTDPHHHHVYVVELDELGAGPARAELAREDLVHPVGAHRGTGLLQLGERGAVGPEQLLGERDLGDAHRLAELHRSAL